MCKKTIVRSCFISLLLFASFCISSLFLSSNSYAVSDLTYTFTQNVQVSSTTRLFPDCDQTCYSQYSYLIYSVPFPVQANFSFGIYFSNSNSYYAHNISFSNYSSIIYLNGAYDLRLNNNFKPSFSGLSITLSDHIPSSLCPGSPSGSLDITENGTYDVTDYSSAVVNVPAEVVYGDYHDDLVSIKVSILICGAIIIVLYFFYCIYRLIIKNSGVK